MAFETRRCVQLWSLPPDFANVEVKFDLAKKPILTTDATKLNIMISQFARHALDYALRPKSEHPCFSETKRLAGNDVLGGWSFGLFWFTL